MIVACPRVARSSTCGCWPTPSRAASGVRPTSWPECCNGCAPSTRRRTVSPHGPRTTRWRARTRLIEYGSATVPSGRCTVCRSPSRTGSMSPGCRARAVTSSTATGCRRRTRRRLLASVPRVGSSSPRPRCRSTASSSARSCIRATRRVRRVDRAAAKRRRSAAVGRSSGWQVTRAAAFGCRPRGAESRRSSPRRDGCRRRDTSHASVIAATVAPGSARSARVFGT